MEEDNTGGLFAYSVSPRELRQLDLAEDRIKRSIQHLRRKRNASATNDESGNVSALSSEEYHTSSIKNQQEPGDSKRLEKQLGDLEEQLQLVQRKKGYFLSILELLACESRYAWIHLKSTTDGGQGEALRGYINAVDGRFSFVQISNLETNMGTYPEVIIRSTDISQVTWDALQKTEYDMIQKKRQHMDELPS
eukprot:gb/GECG01003763.1/.p1 GENE.gb/GECG01003763.1/~~gb/GECG01003763.1/.p1  ORF type:complete len:193 (+),score=28.83 gb/GECG01003763.1/:1-579(+)